MIEIKYNKLVPFYHWLNEFMNLGLKILTPKKLLTRLPILLLAQIKAGNNSYKLKNEIRPILHFYISTIKSLKKVTTI